MFIPLFSFKNFCANDTFWSSSMFFNSFMLVNPLEARTIAVLVSGTWCSSLVACLFDMFCFFDEMTLQYAATIL